MFHDFISEVKLSRVVSKISDDTKPFAILTAFRGENDLSKNKSLNVKLEKDIRSEGYGFFKVKGSYVENEGTPEEKEVEERSFFVTGKENDNGNLKGFVKKMLKKYSQESAVFKDLGSDVFLLYQNGSVDKLGDFHPNKLSKYMSRLVQHPNSTFVFEQIKKYRNSSMDIRGAELRGEKDYPHVILWEK